MSAVNIADLHSYTLQNLFGTHCYPIFVHTAHLPSTLLYCVCTHCRTVLLCTSVLHSTNYLFATITAGYIPICCLSTVKSLIYVRPHCRTSLVPTCRRRIPVTVCTADATPSGVSRVRVTQMSLQECDLGLHRTVTVDSHRQRTDTSYESAALASLEWTCFPLPLTR